MTPPLPSASTHTCAHAPVPAAAGALPAPCFAGLPRTASLEFERLCRFCETHRIEVLAGLPWVAAEIAGAHGFEPMLRLVRELGGRRVYLSRDRAACSARLGLPLEAPLHARLLDRASAAGTIELPSAWGVFVGLRRVAIRAAVRAGQRQREVAQAFGVTERHLRRELDSLQARPPAATAAAAPASTRP